MTARRPFIAYVSGRGPRGVLSRALKVVTGRALAATAPWYILFVGERPGDHGETMPANYTGTMTDAEMARVIGAIPAIAEDQGWTGGIDIYHD